MKKIFLSIFFGLGIFATLWGPIAQSVEKEKAAAGAGFKTIATLEEKMRTFQSLSDSKGSLFVWGGYANLYAAQVDTAGNTLIAAKKIASSKKRFTGIAKPVAWNGGWLLGVRETNHDSVDEIRLIHLDAAGNVVHNEVWLKNFERISLPVFLGSGKNLKGAYFASTPQEGGLFLTTLSDLKKIGVPKQIKLIKGKVIYPPILLGSVYDNAYAMLLYFRSQNPPPMRFLMVDGEAKIQKESEIKHEGQTFKLSEPVFEVVGQKIKIAWFESITKEVPPRLIVADFTKVGEISREVKQFNSPAEIPQRQLSFNENGLTGLGSVMVLPDDQSSGVLQITLPTGKPSSLIQSIINPQLPSDRSLLFSELLHLDKSRNSGLLLSSNELHYFSYSETEKKEETMKVVEKNIFTEFKQCREAKTSRKKCAEKTHKDLYEKKGL